MAGKKKTAKGQKGANAQAQSANQLKNGPRNAARALKKTQRVAQRAGPPPVVPPVVLPRQRHMAPTRFHGRADPRLVAKEPVAQSKHETYYEIVENTDKKKKLEYQVRIDIPISKVSAVLIFLCR